MLSTKFLVVLFVLCVGCDAQDCDILDDITEMFDIKYEKVTFPSSYKIYADSIVVNRKEEKLRKIFKTDKKACARKVSNLELTFHDSAGNEKISMDVKNQFYFDVPSVDPCEEYTVRLTLRLDDGSKVERQSTFGPYHKEVDIVQEETNLDIKKEIKLDLAGLKLEDQTVIITLDKFCGKSMAVFLEKETEPRQVYNEQDLKAVDTFRFDVDGCQTISQEKIFVETFFPPVYKKDLTPLQVFTAHEDLVIPPERAQLAEISYLGTQVAFKKPVGVKECMDKVDISFTFISEAGPDEIIKNEDFDLNDELDLSVGCSEMSVKVEAVMKDDQSRRTPMGTLRYLTNEEGALVVPSLIKEGSKVRVESSACSGADESYVLEVQEQDTQSGQSTYTGDRGSMVLDFSTLPEYQACETYHVVLKSSNTSGDSFRLNELDVSLAGKEFAPRIISTYLEGNKVNITVSGHHKCQDIEAFQVYFREFESKKEMDQPLVSSKESSTYSSLKGLSKKMRYEARAKVMFTDGSESIWSDWSPISGPGFRAKKEFNTSAVSADQKDVQRIAVDGNMNNDDDVTKEEGGSPLSAAIGGGVILIVLLVGVAFGVKKHIERKKRKLNIVEIQQREKQGSSNFTLLDETGNAVSRSTTMPKSKEQLEEVEMNNKVHILQGEGEQVKKNEIATPTVSRKPSVTLTRPNGTEITLDSKDFE